MSIPYQAPEFQLDGFNCPHCTAFSKMSWSWTKAGTLGNNIESLMVCYCSRCGKFSLWFEKEMVYPKTIEVEDPNDDIPESVKTDYLEAATIIANSPRGASALLRLSIEKLVDHLKAKGKDLNEKIGNLVKDGLSLKIQKALDVVRVVGNSAVHPGQIDLKDDKETALTLFRLINIIADELITKPKEIDTLYEIIVPEKTKTVIKKRDGK